MHLPDHRVAVALQAVIEAAVPEAIRVGERQIHHHAPIAVDANRAGIGIHSLLGAEGGGDRVGVVSAVAAIDLRGPDALLLPGHLHGIVGVHAVAGFKEIQGHGAGRGGPDLEGSLIPVDHGAQIVAVIGIVLNKFLAVEQIRGNGGNLAIALDLHRVSFGHVQILPEGDIAHRHIVVQAGELCDLDLPAILADMDLIQALDLHGGTDHIVDLVGGNNARQREGPDGVQRHAAVIADVLHGVTGLEVDHRIRAGHGHKTVFLHVLGGVAPGLAAGVGAVTANNEAHLGDILRYIHHALGAVVTGIEELAAAVPPRKPDPYVTLCIVCSGMVPVDRQLIATRFPLQEEFLLRGSRLFGRRGFFRLCRLLRFCGFLRICGFLRGTLPTGSQQRNQHQKRKKQGQDPMFFHFYNLP